MSAADGLRLAMQWNRDSADRERQAKLDAVAAEEMDRKRKGWAETDAANSQLDTLMAADVERLKNPQADPRLGAFYENVGLGAAGVRPPQSFGGVGNDPAVQGNAGLPAGIQPRYQSPPQTDVQPVGVSPQRQQALTALEMARAARDRAGYLNASGLLAQHDLGAQTAQIYERALQATPEQMGRWAQTFSDNSRITGKANFDPKTGMTTIAMEAGAPVVLNRAQAAEYIAGLWKMKNGDPTGLDSIKNINKDLAAAAKDSFDALNKVTGTNNESLAKGQGLLNDNARLANDNARLGLSRSEHAARIDAAKMGQVRTYQAPDGTVKEMYPVTNRKGGVEWKEVPTPAGMKPYSLTAKPAVSPEAQQKYRDAVVELGPQPAAGTKDAVEWDTRKKFIDQVYGVAQAQSPLPPIAPPPRAAPPVPAQTPYAETARAPDPKARAEMIREALAKDDAIWSGGFGGFGLRAIQQGAMPMGVGQRAELESELRRLTGGK